MGKVTSRQRFLILRGTDEQRKTGETVFDKAETSWAFVDYRTGSPNRIPPEMFRAFEIVTSDATHACFGHRS